MEDGTYNYVDFEDGKKEGKEIVFYVSGAKKWECFFKDGIIEGK